MRSVLIPMTAVSWTHASSIAICIDIHMSAADFSGIKPYASGEVRERRKRSNCLDLMLDQVLKTIENNTMGR